jgi:hypothetical protein
MEKTAKSGRRTGEKGILLDSGTRRQGARLNWYNSYRRVPCDSLIPPDRLSL